MRKWISNATVEIQCDTVAIAQPAFPWAEAGTNQWFPLPAVFPSFADH